MLALWIMLAGVALSAWGAFLWVLLPRLSPVRAAKRAHEEPLRGVVEALAVRMADLEAKVKALPSELTALRDEAKRAADRATYHAGRLVEERSAREQDAWAAEDAGVDDGEGNAGRGREEGVFPLHQGVDGNAGPTQREIMNEAHAMLVRGSLGGN